MMELSLSLLLLTSQCVFTQVLGTAVVLKFDADRIGKFVKAHNDIRAQVSNPVASDMQTMSWDENLARIAEANVKTCVMKHTLTKNRKTDEFELVGENLYDHWGGNNTQTLENIAHRTLTAWYSEVSDYHFENRTCTGKMCGHYTQVVWATSFKVGCAIAVCDGVGGGLNGILVCCNYGPAGNQEGPDGPHSPYKVGEPCTECFEGQSCNNNLCRTPDGVTPPPELMPVLGLQQLSQDLKNDLVMEHNVIRSTVNDPQASDMQKLVWDDELANVAEENVRGCVRKHTRPDQLRTSRFPQIGENLYLYRGTDKSLDNIASRIVSKWFSEEKDYDFKTRTCTPGKMCTHYSQLIWASTTSVGCAIAVCNGEEEGQVSGILACCNYGPPGNLMDENGFLSPYTQGTPCTRCKETQTCSDKLCYTASEPTNTTPKPTQTPSPTTPKPAKPTQAETTSTVSTSTSRTTAAKLPQPSIAAETTKPTESVTSAKSTEKLPPSGTPPKPTEPSGPSPSTPTAAKMPSNEQSSAIPAVTQEAVVSNTIANTQEPANSNATSPTPVSTTSAERSVHTNQLLLVAAISYLTGWFFTSQRH